MSDIDEMGAVDWLLIEFHDKEINGELVPPLLDLVDRRLIRILDALILVKRGEGDFDALTTSDLDPKQVATWVRSRVRRRSCFPAMMPRQPQR